MTSSPPRGAVLSFVLAALCASGAACRRDPPDLREWRPSDHANASGEGAGSGAQSAAARAGGASDDDGDPALAARALWSVQCASCHGRAGRGDGPQAAMARPPDLTDPSFQRDRTDEALARSITEGKNAMPAFGAALRPEAVRALVRLVRELGGVRVP